MWQCRYWSPLESYYPDLLWSDMGLFDYVGYVLFALLMSGFLGIGIFVYREFNWEKSPCIVVDAKLIQRSYVASTRTRNHGVYCTVWDCGQYGICSCGEKEVFRRALPESKLKIKYLYNDVRVYGVV